LSKHKKISSLKNKKPPRVGGTARVTKNNSSTQVSDSTHRQGVSNLPQKRRSQTVIRVLFVSPSYSSRKELRLQRGFLAPTIHDELNLFVGCSPKMGVMACAAQSREMPLWVERCFGVDFSEVCRKWFASVNVARLPQCWHESLLLTVFVYYPCKARIFPRVNGIRL
jgi:hypothetical protein